MSFLEYVNLASSSYILIPDKDSMARHSRTKKERKKEEREEKNRKRNIEESS